MSLFLAIFAFMKPVKKRTSRAERRASEEAYLKREGRLDKRTSRLAKKGDEAKRKKVTQKFIKKELNILDKEVDKKVKQHNRGLRKYSRKEGRAMRKG